MFRLSTDIPRSQNTDQNNISITQGEQDNMLLYNLQLGIVHRPVTDILPNKVICQLQGGIKVVLFNLQLEELHPRITDILPYKT